MRLILADAAPRDALETYLLALNARDGETLRVATLPDDAFPWLLRGRPAGPSDLAR